MRVLITGGAGFIGSHSCEALLAAGHSVTVLDNFATGARANLPAGVDLVEGDVTDPVAVERAVAGCDAVLHLAALVSVPQSLQEPVLTFQVNAAGTAIVLEAARQAGVRRFVLASTCAIYGELPGRKDENSPIQPQVPYSSSKLVAEQWVQLYARAYGMEGIIFRYFNVYGPRQRADSAYSGVIARWCAAMAAGQACRIFGDGTQSRDFVSVHDVVAANLLALTGDGFAWGGVYPVATETSVTLNELFAALRAVAPRPVEVRYEPARPGDVLDSAGSSRRLHALGWRPAVSIEAGLAELAGIAP